MQRGIDTGISGQEDPAVHSFPPKIGNAKLCRREQQICLRIYRYPELFFRPWAMAVVAAQTGLDVAHRNAAQLCRQRTSQGARSVALNDHQLG
jgi:hypothetical protein